MGATKAHARMGWGMGTAIGVPTAKRPSLRDVAKAAGVTAAAVSYVVNGRTDQVGADTLARILEAIERLKYRPQRRGQSLRLNREFAIGLIILDPDPHFLADPFTTQIASGLSNALVEPGFGLMVTGARTLDDLKQFLNRAIGVDALAIIVSGPPTLRERAYQMVGETGLPVAVIQDDAPAVLSDAASILQDDEGGGAALAAHLMSGGATSFLFVAPSRNWPAIERRETGILSALAGKFAVRRIECEEHDHLGTVAAIETSFSKDGVPDAILGGNDHIAIAAMKALQGRGLHAGRDVRVTGFNNFPFRNYATPLVTSVTSSAYEIGCETAEAILWRLDNGSFRRKRLELPVSLAPGETS